MLIFATDGAIFAFVCVCVCVCVCVVYVHIHGEGFICLDQLEC